MYDLFQRLQKSTFNGSGVTGRKSDKRSENWYIQKLSLTGNWWHMSLQFVAWR